MVLIAIDYGTHDIGLATTDTKHRIVMPLPVLKNDLAAVGSLVQILSQHKCDKVLIGRPPRASIWRKVQRFAQELYALSPIPQEFVDESLSTNYARNMLSLGANKKKRLQQIDSFSAVLLLEEWLLSHNPT